MIRKTKIIATIGPSTSERKVLKKIIEKGVNVCRLNFSHIKHEKAKEIISTIKSINQELNVNTAILAASFFTDKLNLVSVVGGDFPESAIKMLENHNVDTKGLQLLLLMSIIENKVDSKKGNLIPYQYLGKIFIQLLILSYRNTVKNLCKIRLALLLL